MRGNASIIRVSASSVAGGKHVCPVNRALKARPTLRPASKLSIDEPPMVLGLVMDALDRVEHHGQTVDEALNTVFADWPDGPASSTVLTGYVDHAVRAYLAAVTPRAGGRCLEPVARWWVVQHVGQDVRELWAWGRRYESVDGQVRELRLLRLGAAEPLRRDGAEIAVAAHVTAHGFPAARPGRWHDRFVPERGPRPARVVVSEVGLLDGSVAVLFDGTAAQASDRYEQVGRHAVTAMIGGRATRPGGDCLKCRLLTVCRDVPRTPCLLGFRGDPGVRVRQVSISDLRTYAECPTQYWLRAMHLPRPGEYRERARLGQAVHEFLERRHASVREPCRVAEMPAGGGWASARWDVDDDDALVGARMLAHHPQVCPIQPDAADVRVEPTLVFLDTAAKVLVIAKPDLVYRDGGGWVWRETKTTRKPPDGREIMDAYPQVALATAVLAAGALGGPVDGSRVELEILRPSGVDMITIDPAESANLAQAQATLRRLAEPWRGDAVFAPAPGRNCRTCPVRRWCPFAADQALPEERTDGSTAQDP
jgi:CRISPR/Cas system-associated exonuclease Cas4 (RecB family)